MKVLIVNGGNRPINIDGRMLAVGAQAVFEKSVVPAVYHKYIDGSQESDKPETDDSETESSDPLVVLLAQAIPAIKLELPGLEVDELQALKRLEEDAEGSRSGLLEAISAEILGRSE